MPYRIAVDIGGTFTDCVVVDQQGERTVSKALTRYGALDEGVVEAVALNARQLGLSESELLADTELFVHGTTQATNALITHEGALVGLITTAGHEDVLSIGRVYSKIAGLTERDLVHSSRLAKPKPIVPRRLIRGINERIDRDGDVVVPLSDDEVIAAIRALVAAGVEAIAVSFLWSFVNDAHEQRVRQLLAEHAPGVFASISSQVAPVLGEYERTATTAVNAYVGPKVVDYLERLDTRLRAHGHRQPLLVMQASGGLTSVADAASVPIVTLDSGPVGGILGCQYLGSLYGETNVIGTDVGGTSFDVGLIRGGEIPLHPDPVVAQYNLRLPKILIDSIGSGGGSIAWIDEGGLLRVGPQSAGSRPGPACYGLGGAEATVTDADLVLGYLDSGAFLGGRMPLDRDLALKALARLGGSLGMEPEEVAIGVFTIINAQMADLIRKLTIEQGHDPRECILVAYGGAGPTHAAFYGSDIGCTAILVPARSTAFSAEGMLACDITHTADVSRTRVSPLADDDIRQIGGTLDALQERLRRQFQDEGTAAEAVSYARSLGVRFRNQVQTLPVPLADGPLGADLAQTLPAEFARRYAQVYGEGAVLAGGRIEIDMHRVVGTHAVSRPPLAARTAADAPAAPKGQRQVHFGGAGFMATEIFDGAALQSGQVITGPAVIERMGDSVAVPPGYQATVDPYLSLRLTKAGAVTAQQAEAPIDPVTFEVIRHRLWAINDDQARMAARLASTPIVYDGYDFNAALVTADGRGLVTGVYIMQHGSTLDDFVRRLIADWPREELRPGDMFYSNDPWWGPLHHNDGVLAMPIFYNGEIVAWSGLVMHDNDVGSPVPGSFVAGAANRFDEAPLFPAVKLVENYKIRHDIERIKLRNCRTPELNALNMRARVAALRTTEQRLGELIAEYGIDTFVAAQEGIIDYVARVVRQRLRDIPDGTWFAQGYLDHDGRTDSIYRICCRVTKRGERLTVDFTGTSPQASGAVNCTRPAMEGAVIGVILISLCYDLPWTVGALRQLVDIVSEEGTINNAVGDAAVSMASVQGTLCTQDVVANAVGKMLLCTDKFRSEAQASWAPGINFGVLAAMDRGELSVEAVIDAFPGGGGARSFTDGIDSGGIYHSMGSRVGNAETFESRSPVLQVYRREIRDTGGSGRYRGGVTVGFGNVVHKAESDATLGLTASGAAMPGGFGLAGGAPGAAVSNVILRRTDVHERLASGLIPVEAADVLTSERVDVRQAKDFTEVGPDDFVISVNNAGGGFGDPLLREPAAVARDVSEGLVSAAIADSVYGVVLAGGGEHAVDEAATTARRAALRQERLALARPVRPGQGGGIVAGGQVLHPVADVVEAVAAGGQRLLRCGQCQYRLGDYTEDYKQGTVYRDSPLISQTPFNRLCDLDSYVFRQFFCPGCGTLLVTDVQAVGEEIRDECRLFGREGS